MAAADSDADGTDGKSLEDRRADRPTAFQKTQASRRLMEGKNYRGRRRGEKQYI